MDTVYLVKWGGYPYSVYAHPLQAMQAVGEIGPPIKESDWEEVMPGEAWEVFWSPFYDFQILKVTGVGEPGGLKFRGERVM